MSSARPSGSVRVAEGGAQRMTSPSILVVDDIQDNLDLIVELFEGEPWNARTADNSKNTWALIKRWHPDLVLLDIQMPDYNGHHLCAAIRMKSDMDDISVIFLTAERTSEAEIERGMKMGAVDYIYKPADGATLRERVRTVVEHCPNRPARTGSNPSIATMRSNGEPMTGIMDDNEMNSIMENTNDRSNHSDR